MPEGSKNIRLAARRAGFKRGDVVSLRCGGPKMVVVKPQFEQSSRQRELVAVMFWNESGRTDRRQSNIDPSALTEVEGKECLKVKALRLL